MGEFIRHVPCVNPKCTSSDGMAMYADGTGHCFVCRYNYSPNEEHKAKRGVKKVQELQVKQKPGITEEQHQEIKDKTVFEAGNYRGISDEVNKFFGCRTEFKEGEVYRRYYPCTTEGKISGYKVRKHPKEFSAIGNVGNKNDLYGSFRFQAGGKYLLISGGEEDCHAAYQMFKEYSESKGGGFVTAVVSPTVGETSAAKQIAHNYEFLNKFETIFIGFDADEAGREATSSIIDSLPKGKVRIVSWSKGKDPNDYLEKGLNKYFISDFYNAKPYVPAGVVGSSELYNKLVENANTERIPLPPFMHKLDEMLGGIELGTIGVLAAGSGSAKTTVANELLYFLIFNSPYKIGVVSLELTCAQYGQAMLSRHMEKKISRIRDANERVQFLQTQDVKDKALELFVDSEGNDRFMIIDERDGALAILQEKIEQLVIACKCKLIILDPVSDLLDGISNDEQALFMKWCKSIIKNYNVSFLLISHIRKSSTNKDSASTGAFVPEEAIMGSSTIFKSASWVVMMQRDKYNEDEIKRNTTHLVLSKNRTGSVTGHAGDLYYDSDEHKLYDLEQWQESYNGKPQSEF